MSYTHLLLEVYCLNAIGEEEEAFSDIPLFCKNGVGNPGYHCLAENCKHVAYTMAPYEIAYAGEFGEVPDSDAWIGFGGDMEPIDADERKMTELRKIWEEVCRKKIQEAYEEYMRITGLK